MVVPTRRRRLKSVRVGRAARNVYALQGQSFDAHPVEMTFVTSVTRASCLMWAEGEVEYEGDRAHPVETYHGHASGAPTGAMGNLLGSPAVNAARLPPRACTELARYRAAVGWSPSSPSRPRGA